MRSRPPAYLLIAPLVFAAMLLASCGGGDGYGDANGTPGGPGDPFTAAKGALARQLDSSVENIPDPITITSEDWPDSCLGLGASGEACAEVITRGYEVVFRVDGDTYTYRTNATGTIVRFDEAASP